MYHITDEQIDYMLHDIKQRGVDIEDLQCNLLDHLCCIIEQELEENGDFEQFYLATIQQFYRKELREIQDETINLLTFKNYYAMKKAMIVSGTTAAAAFVAGSVFKMMYWPGASALLILGIGMFSLVFLPLLLALKAREVQTTAQKFVLAIGCCTATAFALAILFIVQHWPGANILLFGSLGIAAFVLLPSYFFTGIRRAETRLNTMVMSIILVGIIGLQFTMVRLHPTGSQLKLRTIAYAEREVLLKKMQPARAENTAEVEIDQICEQLKSIVLSRAIGYKELPTNYSQMQLVIGDGTLGPEFKDNSRGAALAAQLAAALSKYNTTGDGRIVAASSLMSTPTGELWDTYTSQTFLDDLQRLQMNIALVK